MAKLSFFASLVMLFYIHFGYPLCLAALNRLKGGRSVRKADITPSVSMVVAAYNEEAAIGEKLENVLALDYPKDNLEVYVVSDHSSDRTDEIVQKFADRGVKLIRLEQRSGKIRAYRRVLPLLQGQIIVFSDSTSRLEHDSLKKLVRNFNDPGVGCVGALLRQENPEKVLVGEGHNNYWDYEVMVKRWEGNLASLTSVSGTLYAVRKQLFPDDIKDDLADDLIVPIHTVKRGFRTVLEEEAVCTELAAVSVEDEFRRRVRITIQNVRGLLDQFDILNPLRYGLYAWCVASHKLLRLLIPVFLLILFAANTFLAGRGDLYLLFLALQTLFYLLGFTGYVLHDRPSAKLLTVVFFFCMSNVAILSGIIKFLAGRKVVTWEPVRLET